MDNQLNQSSTSKEHGRTTHHGAHGGSRSGISDYHDGGFISHYGGNEDTKLFGGEEELKDEEQGLGQIAYGNDNDEQADESEEDYGKYHSGL